MSGPEIVRPADLRDQARRAEEAGDTFPTHTFGHGQGVGRARALEEIATALEAEPRWAIAVGGRWSNADGRLERKAVILTAAEALHALFVSTRTTVVIAELDSTPARATAPTEPELPAAEAAS